MSSGTRGRMSTPWIPAPSQRPPRDSRRPSRDHARGNASANRKPRAIPRITVAARRVRGVGILAVDVGHDLARRSARHAGGRVSLVSGADRRTHNTRDRDASLSQARRHPGVIGAESDVEELHAPIVKTIRLYVKPLPALTRPDNA